VIAMAMRMMMMMGQASPQTPPHRHTTTLPYHTLFFLANSMLAFLAH